VKDITLFINYLWFSQSKSIKTEKEYTEDKNEKEKIVLDKTL